MSSPEYLTGKKEAIGEFLDKFDVCLPTDSLLRFNVNREV